MGTFTLTSSIFYVGYFPIFTISSLSIATTKKYSWVVPNPLEIGLMENNVHLFMVGMDYQSIKMHSMDTNQNIDL